MYDNPTNGRGTLLQQTLKYPTLIKRMEIALVLYAIGITNPIAKKTITRKKSLISHLK